MIKMNVKLVGIAPGFINGITGDIHSEWEIVLNSDGCGKTSVNGEEYDFSPGVIICMPPNSPHSKYSEGKFRDIFIRVDEFPLINGNNVSVFKDDEEKSVETLMNIALRAFHKKEKNYQAVTDALMESIYQILLSWCDERRKNIHVELFKNELIKNFTDPEFKLWEAGKTTNYCSGHFRRLFKADTGVTPMSYLNGLRIEYAKKLLRKRNITGMSIAEAALKSGFYDPRYFSRVFKNAVGVTPAEYSGIG
jgi:AraC-like DNA-binding protein